MNGLFVSDQHRQTISYRTGPFYRGTFHVLFILMVLQFPAVGLYSTRTR